MRGKITVIDVCRSLGVEPTPDLTWAVGNAVRREYEERYGELPPKALRPKTNGGGSHCFAVYDAGFRPVIVRAIKAHGAAAARQGSLFG